MTKISVNKNNIDEYYKTVNTKIDHYFEKGVSPNALKNYFSNEYGVNKFLKREKLENIKGIEKIIKDVVDDRMSLNENMMTFEQYKDRSDDYQVYFKVDQNIEKVIADEYLVSLGHIDNKDNLNRINLKGIKREKEIFVFSNDDLSDIYNQVCDKLYDRILSKTLSDPSLDIKIKLSDKIEKSIFISNSLSDIQKDKSVIENVLFIVTSERFVFTKVLGDINIFEKS